MATKVFSFEEEPEEEKAGGTRRAQGSSVSTEKQGTGADGAAGGGAASEDAAGGASAEGTAHPLPDVCTYTLLRQDAEEADPAHPLLILDNTDEKLTHHTDGLFAAPGKRTQFCFRGMRADIRQIDQRFVELLRWLGTNEISVRLSGQDTSEGYAVYKICEIDTGSGTKLSAEDGFLQYVISRLLETKAPELSSQGAGVPEEDEEADSDEMKLTSLQSMTDFLDCARSALPANIRNLAIAKSSDVSQEEKRHAQHALSLMLNIRWKDSYFGAIDPDRARRILDEELYGMEKVKQRIIETIIQINRTHTLPAYGLLLVGPAGTGKSQIAYAVARILGLPWTSLDMSSIHDPEQLTGSSRVYSNAKPGSIMEAFSLAGESNLVFIINELDKADSKDSTGSPADALLTLLDNLGFTDNYMECTIPTAGVYPIATANDKSRISEPLLTRFAVIDIPDYTPEEKKQIFLRYSLPRVLRRMGLRDGECIVTEEAAQAVVEEYRDMPGVRDLEQAAEHLAANALYQIETASVRSVVFDRDAVQRVLG